MSTPSEVGGDLVVVDALELRSLANAARSARRDVDAGLSRMAGIMGSVDRRGWNAGAADGAWWSTRSGLQHLETDLEQHAAILDERANLVDRFDARVDADLLATWTPTPTPIPTSTPTPDGGSTPQPVPAPPPTGTPTVPDASPASPASATPWDFWASRAIDIATESYKALTQEQVVTRVIPQLVEITQREVTAVVGDNPQVVAYVIRQTTSQAVVLTTKEELLNGPAIVLKDFLASPLEGAPLVGGAVQGVSDWVTEPNLTTGQRIGRVVVAGGAGTLIAIGVALTLPEDAAVVAVVGVTVLAGAAVDTLVKPVVFDKLGLNAPKESLGEPGQPAPVLP